MTRNLRAKAGGVLLAAAIALFNSALADFEVTGPDGRKILLKDDGTWRYVDAKDREPAQDAKGKPREETGEAVLRLEGKAEIGSNCRYELRLVNNLPYEIRSIAPTFSALRSNGVSYDSVLATFQTIRPGDSQRQEIQFRGIPCQDIARVQVLGGDRCVMGELDRFGKPDGACLKLVRVMASELVRFDK